jgi:hypothetical protein
MTHRSPSSKNSQTVPTAIRRCDFACLPTCTTTLCRRWSRVEGRHHPRPTVRSRTGDQSPLAAQPRHSASSARRSGIGTISGLVALAGSRAGEDSRYGYYFNRRAGPRARPEGKNHCDPDSVYSCPGSGAQRSGGKYEPARRQYSRGSPPSPSSSTRSVWNCCMNWRRPVCLGFC